MESTVDIPKKTSAAKFEGVEAIRDLQTAGARLQGIQARSPGEYVVFSQHTQSVQACGGHGRFGCSQLDRQTTDCVLAFFPSRMSLLSQRGTEATRCSVLLADDSDLMRRMIERLLQEEPGIELLGQAKSFAQTLEMTAELKPQVVVMDLHMPDETAFEPDFIRSQLLRSAKHIVIMSVWNDEKSQALANSYGAASFLDKTTLSSTLIPAILKLC
jgi:CheY-like chemotaxis protein